jgi:predicted MFS family arabinose efflux permease
MTPARPRLQILSIFTAYAAAGVYWGSYITALPAFRAIAGMDAAAFGWLLTLTTIGGIVAMQIWGRLLHRLQAVAIPVCLMAFALGMVLFGLARGPWSLGAAMFLSGAASGALDISLNMRVARIEGDLTVRLFNRVHALFPVAMLVTSLAVGWLRDGGLTPAQIFPPAALALLAAAALEWRAGQHQRPAAGPGSATTRLPLTPLLAAFGALAALGAMTEGGAHTWSALFVEGELGASPLWGGLAAAAITLGLTTGRLTAHALEQRLTDMALIRLALILTLPAFVLLLAIAGLFLAGVGVGPVEPAVFRAVTRRHPEETRGRALALATGLAYAGYLCSPPVLGMVIDGAGWPAMWLVLIGFALLAGGLTLRIPAARPGAAG